MTNWQKKATKNNYGKGELKRINVYYTPLINWIKYNYFKVMQREAKEQPKAL